MKQISELQEKNHCKLRQTPQFVASRIKVVYNGNLSAPFWGSDDLKNISLGNQRKENSTIIQKIKLSS